MIKKTIGICILSTFYCIHGCDNMPQPPVESIADPVTYKVDVEAIQDKVSLNDFFSQAEPIPLETSSSSAIGFLSKVVSHEDKFYVYDRQEFCIHIFSRDGRFLTKIKNEGEGPGEFYALTDFNLNKYNKKWEFLTPQGEFIEFDETTNKYNSLFSLPVQAVHYFGIISSDIIVFYSLVTENQLLYYSRSKNSIIKEDLVNTNKEGKIRTIPFISPLFEILGNFHFMNPFSYDTFIIDPNNLELKKVKTFDFGKFNLNPNDIPGEASNDLNVYIRHLKENQSCFPIFGYFENKNVFAFSFQQGASKLQTLIYNKRQGKYAWLDLPLSEEEQRYFYPFFSTSNENEPIGCIYNPTEFLSKVRFPSEGAKQPGFLQSSDVESNPVLLKYKIKE